MNPILSPAVKILDKLRFIQKFIVIMVVVTLMVTGILYILLANLNSQIDFSAKERAGVAYINPLKKFMVNVQRHTDTLYYTHRTDPSLEQSIDENITEIDKINEQLHKTLAIENRWNTLKDKWAVLKSSHASLSKQAYFQDSKTYVEEIISLISYVGDKSNLILDPDLDSYYLMDGYVVKLPYIIHQLFLLKKTGHHAIKNKSYTMENKISLISFKELLQYNLDALIYGINVVYKETKADIQPDLKPTFDQAQASLIKILDMLTKDMIHQDQWAVSNQEFQTIVDTSYDQYVVLEDVYAKSLDHLLLTRIKSLDEQKPWIIGSTAFILFVVLYLFVAFYTSIQRSTNTINKATQRLSTGDFTVDLTLSSKDEIKEIADNINTLKNQLRALLTDITNSSENVAQHAVGIQVSSEQIAHGGQEVAHTMSQLAAGVQNQAHSVQDSVEKINRVNEAIQSVMTNAEKTAKIAQLTENNAKEGYIQTEKAVEKSQHLKELTVNVSQTINELGSLSSQIGIIVDLIRNIAGQTNLLALNAAIEAARAGEHGKGFAVVAEEVKKLAGQSAQATDQITDMIKQIQSNTASAVTTMNQNVTEVAENTEIIENVKVALKRIEDASISTNDNVQLISDEITALQASSESIVKIMENISSVTEETAASTEEVSSITEEQTANLEEISASSQILAKLAEDLKNQISIFKI